MTDVPLPRQSRIAALRAWGCFFISLIGIGLICWFALSVRAAREAALSSNCRGRMGQLLLALHNYHDTYGSFPPAYIADANGKPMHSWRTLILPFLDGNDIYHQYRFDEPWDSPHNSALARKCTNERYHCPSGPQGILDPMTNYVVIVGPATAFPNEKTVTMTQIIDGLESTILIAEIRDSKIHWMEPRDLAFDEMSFKLNDQTRPSISSPHPAGAGVVFGDSIRTYRLESGLRPETLRALTTIAGNEPVSKDRLLRRDVPNPIFLTE